MYLLHRDSQAIELPNTKNTQQPYSLKLASMGYTDQRILRIPNLLVRIITTLKSKIKHKDQNNETNV
jgi:hypothetical protein